MSRLGRKKHLPQGVGGDEDVEPNGPVGYIVKIQLHSPMKGHGIGDFPAVTPGLRQPGDAGLYELA
jgi:hypothetical protein